MKPPKICCPFARAKKQDEIRAQNLETLKHAADHVVGRGCGTVFNALLSLIIAAMTNGKRYALVCKPHDIGRYSRTVVEIIRSAELPIPRWYGAKRFFRFGSGGEVHFMTETDIAHERFDEAKRMLETDELDR